MVGYYTTALYRLTGQFTGAICIDIRKVFYRVDYATLLCKLPKYGVIDKELKWITDYLFCRQQLVQYRDNFSEKEFVSIGVPQLNWLRFNDLIVNLKPGKTNTVLFGTTQKLKKSFALLIVGNEPPITAGNHYEYLGTVLDYTMSIKPHVDKIAKKATSRVELLSRIRKDVSPPL